MIDLLVTGHKYEHDLYELIRTFFPNEEVKVINSIDEYENHNYLIKSNLDIGDHISKTTIYKNKEVLSDYRVDIYSIIIKDYTKAQIEKISIKKSMYYALSNLSQKHVPWGILTGIRPTKIAHNLIDYGLAKDGVLNILIDDYKLRSEKAKLLLEIVEIQRDYLYPLDKDKFSLYISIPFCPTICSYCSFSSLPFNKYEYIVESYVNNLIYELESISKFMKKDKLNTVYIGGGTPTAISTVFLNRVIEAVHKNFGSNIVEFTVEAGRPDTINREMLLMLKKNGIDRISINPQTMVDETLKLVGRNHSSSDIIKSYYLAKEIGFDNVNMDLILGLPGEGDKELKQTLKQLSKLDPENLTIHSLSLKRGSDYNGDKGAIRHISSFNMSNMAATIDEYVNRMKLYPYYLYRQKQITGNLENIGYSKKGKECIYNISMMEEKETIIGLGMGAVSKIYYPDENKIKRIPNFKGIHDYINRIDELIKKKEDSIN